MAQNATTLKFMRCSLSERLSTRVRLLQQLFSKMIGEGQFDAVGEFPCWNVRTQVKHNRPIPLIFKLVWISLLEIVHQGARAFEIYRVLVSQRFLPIDSYRASTFRFRRQVTWLSPFEGFL